MTLTVAFQESHARPLAASASRNALCYRHVPQPAQSVTVLPHLPHRINLPDLLHGHTEYHRRPGLRIGSACNCNLFNPQVGAFRRHDFTCSPLPLPPSIHLVHIYKSLLIPEVSSLTQHLTHRVPRVAGSAAVATPPSPVHSWPRGGSGTGRCRQPSGGR